MVSLAKIFWALAILALTTAGLIFYFKVPSPPIAFSVETIEPDIHMTYKKGDVVELTLALRSNDLARTLPVEMSAYLFTPTGIIALPKEQFELVPRREKIPLTIKVSVLEEFVAGPYRLRFGFSQVFPDGSKFLMYESDRVFLVEPEKTLMSPAVVQPQPPPAPSVIQAPVVPPKVLQRPKTPPKMAPVKKPAISLVFNKPQGEYNYGERLPIEIELENKGDGAAQVELVVTTDIDQGFSKSLSVKVEAGGKVPIHESLPLDSALNEGTYTLEALAASSEDSPSFPETSVKTQFQLVDMAPKAEFKDLPLSARIGEPVTFRLKASDDRGLEKVELTLFKTGHADFQVVPMRLETGHLKQGYWSYLRESFNEPGSYSFYVVAQDTKGQKIKTEEFSIVIKIR